MPKILVAVTDQRNPRPPLDRNPRCLTALLPWTLPSVTDTTHCFSLIRWSKARVLGFDAQKALAGARELLKFVGSLDRVSFIHDSHSRLTDHLPPQAAIQGAMFNLGYLPRGNRQIITRPETTVMALGGVLSNLAAQGRITILVYRGHEEGILEYVKVREFLEQLSDEEWTVEEFASTSDSPIAPRLFRIQKNRARTE